MLHPQESLHGWVPTSPKQHTPNHKIHDEEVDTRKFDITVYHKQTHTACTLGLITWRGCIGENRLMNGGMIVLAPSSVLPLLRRSTTEKRRITWLPWVSGSGGPYGEASKRLRCTVHLRKGVHHKRNTSEGEGFTRLLVMTAGSPRRGGTPTTS